MKKDITLKPLCDRIRYDILTSTTAAGSGHPTSSLSGVELMATLFFGGFYRFDISNPHGAENDRVIFSKGHAAPLLYALYAAAGAIKPEELMTLRKFGSRLEGHPTLELPFVEVATGSLGQGLSVGVGEALAQRLRTDGKNTPRVFVLLGDSEFAEGQNWEAMQVASHYKLDNLVAILDVNRLGQRGETMLGWDVKTHAKRAEAFGWHVITTDGHNLDEVKKAFEEAVSVTGKPVMIVAKTAKGKGISFLENADNWHGKPVPKDMLGKALQELGEINKTILGAIAKPSPVVRKKTENASPAPAAQAIAPAATREAYGNALVELGTANRNIVVLDAETSNSTYAEKFRKAFPGRFFEMYIAEQNMVSAALGFSKIGYVPFVSSFAAFLTRAFDQIRMSQYAKPNLKIVGSHAGVSIGEDGASQMALEDIAMMRSIRESVVFYPSDAVSTHALAAVMADTEGLFYMRTTRAKTPLLYTEKDTFVIGGSKILKESKEDKAVIISAGITLFESLKAYDELQKKGISVAIIDAYSVKPLDVKTIIRLAKKTGKVIVVEDHYEYGGLGEAVKVALSGMSIPVTHLCVRKMPRSATPSELLSYEELDMTAILNCLV